MAASESRFRQPKTPIPESQPADQHVGLGISVGLGAGFGGGLLLAMLLAASGLESLSYLVFLVAVPAGVVLGFLFESRHTPGSSGAPEATGASESTPTP